MKDAKLLLETFTRLGAILFFVQSMISRFNGHHALSASQGASACFLYIMTLKKSEES